MPGQSSLGSGADVVVGGLGVVVVGRVGAGLGLAVGIVFVLSQQTEPFLQFDDLGINTDGRSQNAAIIFNKQNPGHLGIGS